MRKAQFTLLLTLSLVLLVGCGATPTQPPEATMGVDHSPLPTPETVESPSSAPSVEPSEIATPSPGPGVVTGFLQGGDPPQPRERAILYLGKVITSDDGQPVMAGVNKQTAPKTVTDEKGQFLFTEVPPGRYALVLDLITSTVVLRHPTEGGDLLIEVKEGEVTDLGELIYPDLPSLP